MTTTAPAELIGTADAAKLLGMSRNGINERVNRGTLTPVGVIGKRRTRVFDRAEIEAIARTNHRRRREVSL